MVIAVTTRFLNDSTPEGYGYFIKQVFTLWSENHPQHQFYFLFDRPLTIQLGLPINVHTLIIPPPARHPVLWKIWYDIRLPGILRKIKADVLVCPDGYACLTTSIPQCLVIHDLGFLHYPDCYKKTHALFYKFYTPKYLKRAAAVATVSLFTKNDIIRRYGLKADKVDVVYSAAKEIFRPVCYEDQVQTRLSYTQGKEYFIYIGAIQPRKNLINLLKAFSIFKKRLKSNMKLVISGRLAWKNNHFIQLIETYKYKDDVILTGYVTENVLVNLLGSAYALVYPSFFEGFGVPVLEAMRSDIPVLTSVGTSMEEIAGVAGLYFDPKNISDIADKLMVIYKDEDLRKNLIALGKKSALKFTWERSAGLLWQTMMKCM